MLKLYNTLSKQKEVFQSITPKQVKLYVCGMTIYDFCHLGHARVLVVYDCLVRWLQNLDYQVTYVRNITDIDDKIIKRASENQENIAALTERFILAMHEDSARLNVLPPNFEPRATNYVAAMLQLIEKLMQRGLAYQSDDGDVCYAVRKFDGYGKLSGKSLDELRAGERVDVASGKRDPLDFVLWKRAKAAEPDEAIWDSPWGKGRPGWHIECSAMSEQLLGDHFDIHGGGQDLQFPHHENEIAQSEGAHQCTFVNYWLHNGFVRLDDEKMSKSLGNFFTIREVLQKYDAEVVRFFIIRTHYRSPLNYSDSHLDDARQALTRLYTSLKAYSTVTPKLDQDLLQVQNFYAAMNDDLNTAEAVAAMFDLASIANHGGEQGEQAAANLKALGKILGLLEREAQDFLQSRLDLALSASEIESLIEQRTTAKKAKNFAEADRIRQYLLAQGIIVEDSSAGTSWRGA